jgi:hypothetical protein
MMAIESGEKPTRMLTWKTTAFLSDNVLVVNLVLTITVITFRRVSVYLQHFQRTSG